MGWRRRRTWARKEAEHAPQEGGSCGAAARPAPPTLELLRTPHPAGPANAGRYAALLQAGQQAMGNAALQMLLGQALGGPGREVEAQGPAEEPQLDETASPVETLQVDQENENPGEGAAGGPVPPDKSAPAKPGGSKPAPKTYDMGSPVTNATESFYTIKQPKLARVASHFKFVVNRKRYAGKTSWKWKFDMGKPVEKDGEYVIDPLNYKIERITVEIPRWANFEKASERDKEAWAKFVKAVRVHEQGHVDRVRNYFKAMPAEFKSLRASSLRELRAERRRVQREVDQALRDDADDYDDKTGHGATQGATLIPPAAARPAAK